MYGMNKIITSLFLLLMSLKCLSQGFAAYEVKSFIDKGAEVVVDNSFAPYEIKSFASKNASLVTVIGEGFEAYEIKSFIDNGVIIIIND